MLDTRNCTEQALGTEPANLSRYIEIKEDVVLQVSGLGPSERRSVNLPDRPK